MNFHSQYNPQVYNYQYNAYNNPYMYSNTLFYNQNPQYYNFHNTSFDKDRYLEFIGRNDYKMIQNRSQNNLNSFLVESKNVTYASDNIDCQNNYIDVETVQNLQSNLQSEEQKSKEQKSERQKSEEQIFNINNLLEKRNIIKNNLQEEYLSQYNKNLIQENHKIKEMNDNNKDALLFVNAKNKTPILENLQDSTNIENMKESPDNINLHTECIKEIEISKIYAENSQKCVFNANLDKNNSFSNDFLPVQNDLDDSLKSKTIKNIIKKDNEKQINDSLQIKKFNSKNKIFSTKKDKKIQNLTLKKKGEKANSIIECEIKLGNNCNSLRKIKRKSKRHIATISTNDNKEFISLLSKQTELLNKKDKNFLEAKNISKKNTLNKSLLISTDLLKQKSVKQQIIDDKLQFTTSVSKKKIDILFKRNKDDEFSDLKKLCNKLEFSHKKLLTKFCKKKLDQYVSKTYNFFSKRLQSESSLYYNFTTLSFDKYFTDLSVKKDFIFDFNKMVVQIYKLFAHLEQINTISNKKEIEVYNMLQKLEKIDEIREICKKHHFYQLCFYTFDVRFCSKMTQKIEKNSRINVIMKYVTLFNSFFSLDNQEYWENTNNFIFKFRFTRQTHEENKKKLKADDFYTYKLEYNMKSQLKEKENTEKNLQIKVIIHLLDKIKQKYQFHINDTEMIQNEINKILRKLIKLCLAFEKNFNSIKKFYWTKKLAVEYFICMYKLFFYLDSLCLKEIYCKNEIFFTNIPNICKSLRFFISKKIYYEGKTNYLFDMNDTKLNIKSESDSCYLHKEVTKSLHIIHHLYDRYMFISY